MPSSYLGQLGGGLQDVGEEKLPIKFQKKRPHPDISKYLKINKSETEKEYRQG